MVVMPEMWVLLHLCHVILLPAARVQKGVHICCRGNTKAGVVLPVCEVLHVPSSKLGPGG